MKRFISKDNFAKLSFCIIIAYSIAISEYFLASAGAFALIALLYPEKK